MKPWPYQLDIAVEASEILLKCGIVYLAMEERTGKSLTSLLVAERIREANNILIITKKKALPDWVDLLNCFMTLKNYKVVNYHNAHKERCSYDLVILDEAHNYISGYPKPSAMHADIKLLSYGKPIIYISATPYAQGPQLLYHQFALSYKSPWKKYKDFYSWYETFAKRDKHGQFKTVRISATTTAIDYTAVDYDKVIEPIKHLFITRTRKELGFEQEPEDVLHFIQLSDKTKSVYNELMKNKYIYFTYARNEKDYSLVCDTPTKLRFALHMLEGGVLKIEDEYLDLGMDEKAEYILKTWGDNEDLVIMYQYNADKLKLERLFKKALILQATSNAEGIDLSSYANLVIYSQDFSTARHTQCRARQANRKREQEIKVHFLLVKNAISHQLYKTVKLNKKNFVDSVFERIEL